MCSQGYALRLCKRIYYIKPNLQVKPVQEISKNKIGLLNFKFNMRRTHIVSGRLVLLTGVTKTNKKPWLYSRA
jgi:hypothetical protein